MNYIRKIFENPTPTDDLTKNPNILGHFGELGWALNEGILNNTKNNGLYSPTSDWTKRGEIAVAIIALHLNTIYGSYDNYKNSNMYTSLSIRSLVLIVTQFWLYKPFSVVSVESAADFHNDLFEVAQGYFKKTDQLCAVVGQKAMSLDGNASKALLQFTAQSSGWLRELFVK